MRLRLEKVDKELAFFFINEDKEDFDAIITDLSKKEDIEYLLQTFKDILKPDFAWCGETASA